MKAFHSADYYESNWDRFIQPVRDWHIHYMNLEEELKDCLAWMQYPEFEGHTITEEQGKNIQRAYAKQIAERVEKELREDMRVIRDVDSGKASFGFTTQFQEIAFRREFRLRWEFNCYQLSKFKSAHLS